MTRIDPTRQQGIYDITATNGDTRKIIEEGSSIEGNGGALDLGGFLPPSVGVAPVGVAIERLKNVNHTRITLPATAVTMTDHTTAGSQGDVELYDFPANSVLVLGAAMNLTTLAGVGGIGDTAALVGSIGSAIAGVGDATLTSTEADLIPSTAGSLVAGAGTLVGRSTAVDFLPASSKAYLNLAVPDAGTSANDTITVAGTVDIYWMNL